jgi:uncharacterized protein YeaO (DUF488 family)
VSTAVANNIRLKRVYDATLPEDGYRVLSMRFWPRGVAKTAVDEYTTKTAPSKELLHAFRNEGLAWEPYVAAYLSEMERDEARWEIARLAELAKSRTITLMCACVDEDRCHRSLLRQLVIDAG